MSAVRAWGNEKKVGLHDLNPRLRPTLGGSVEEAPKLDDKGGGINSEVLPLFPAGRGREVIDGLGAIGETGKRGKR